MTYNFVNILDDQELNGRSFVGVSKEVSRQNIDIVVPYGLRYSGKIDLEDPSQKSFLKKYVKVIQKALASDIAKQKLQDIEGINNPFVATKIVLDYLSMGRLSDTIVVDSFSDRGKIDFNQTIKKVQPSIVGDNFYFDRVITRKRIIVDDDFVGDVQCNVINDFISHGGDVLFGQSLMIPTRSIKLDSATVLKLQRELSTTFNSRRESVIRWCIEYIKSIKGNSEESDKKSKWRYAIVASTLWEIMVNSVFGDSKRRPKSAFGKNYYYLSIDNSIGDKGKKTQHDTIYEDKDLLMIIDAKMYGSASGLLSEEVLGKQFGYMMEAASKVTDKPIVSILIRPKLEDDLENQFENRVIPDPHNERLNPADPNYDPTLKGEYDPDKLIFLYTYSTDSLIDDYYYGINHAKELKAKLINFISSPSVKSFLDSRGCIFHKSLINE